MLYYLTIKILQKNRLNAIRNKYVKTSLII